MTENRPTISEFLRKSREAQGLPLRIEDPAAIARIVELLGNAEGARPRTPSTDADTATKNSRKDTPNVPSSPS